MGSERILDFDLHAVAREGSIPTGGIAQADYEIIGMYKLTFGLFAGRQRDNGGGTRAIFAVAGIKHARFELDGRILAGDASEIASRRMTALATTGAIEKGFACVRVSSKQLLDR